ncbi:protein of unknown function [[Clostridium] ultunense Esp]|uniref:Uncharacterized protein n=1 Tax=[Clostridium] ultunense Esp TaxID=1288971 RepID=A0A1M4PPP3_9FIRM|nr:protein of unknown function [[Clostridium] ultunense Esp]
MGLTILEGMTLLNLIPIKVPILILTPEKKAVIHNPTGIKVKNNITKIIINKAIPIVNTNDPGIN